MNKHIAIIGAGPAGLGAAYRLTQLGHQHWTIYEAADHIGGLSASFTDPAGFVWDQGGHVLFTRDEAFGRIAEHLLGEDCFEHVRASWINIGGRYVPYPFQNNIRYLPEAQRSECIKGLIDRDDTKKKGDGGRFCDGTPGSATCYGSGEKTTPVPFYSRDDTAARPSNFAEWIDSTFGDGIARLFMRPYNRKVWAWPAELMSADWIAERVATIDLQRILDNMAHARDDVAWGPNSTFKYPARGGTGGLWDKFMPILRDRLYLNREVVEIDSAAHEIRLADGSCVPYDAVINTSPLDMLVPRIIGAPPAVRGASENLCFNSGCVIGLGFAGRCPSKHNWVYFPDAEMPFYRVTYLSNYSPYVCPTGEHFSLLIERSFSEYLAIDEKHLVEEAIAGCLAAGLVNLHDVENLTSTWTHEITRSYPVPTLGRDRALATIQPFLRNCNIQSVGRFGAWRYEEGNMDHSFMSGVRAVERVFDCEAMTAATALGSPTAVEIHS